MVKWNRKPRVDDSVNRALCCVALAITSGCAASAQRVGECERPEPTPSPPAPANSCSHCCRTDARDFAAPSVVHARLDLAHSAVELRFSEPVVGLERLDPEQFRLSFALAYGPENPGDEAEAIYADPLYYLAEETQADEKDLLRVVEIRTSGDDRARLVLSHRLPSDTCEALDLAQDTESEAEEPKEQAGLFLHYSSDRHRVEDRSGNPMEVMGADWVRSRAVELELTGRPPVQRLDLLVAVECKPDSRGARR